MPEISRRTMLTGTAAVGAGIALGALPFRPGRAAAQSASELTTIKHVVILMQENRSFDHYFGTLQGVRGFGDQATILLSGGYSVFSQPNGSGRQYPWWMSDTPSEDGASGSELAQCDGSLDHSWKTQHEAWDSGKMDDWISAKGSVRTMGYPTRSDIPFHYALADAYTVCDGYHCSILSATGPNRTYLWSGWISPGGTDGGPAYDGGDESGLSWQTYAENLQNAGVTWKVYQNADDNYTDNALAYFTQFADAPASSPLYVNGMSSLPATYNNTPEDIAAAIQADAEAGTLPQVSWIVANQQTSEHPYAAPAYGAQFINQVLTALAASEDVLNSTVVLINYDENDGFFDHVPPPSPPSGTASEFYDDDAIGLGFRVPMIICSPWTRGGWVDSQTYDHTSVIMFLEQWTTALGTPALCPNISAWRRAVCGNLTSAFNFANPVYGLPASLPSTPASPYTLDVCAPLPDPTPETNALPAQETGTRGAIALPYQCNGYVQSIQTGPSKGEILLWVYMGNEGVQATSAVTYAVYANAHRSGGPWQYTCPAYSTSGGSGVVTDYINIGKSYGSGEYDLTLIGPNRFLRRFTGNASTASIDTDVTVTYGGSPVTGDLAIFFSLNNAYTSAVTFTITTSNYFTGGPWTYSVPAGGKSSQYFEAVADHSGWYDFTITVSVDSTWSRRFTGHLETGAASITGSA
jgi:phospholipase C